MSTMELSDLKLRKRTSSANASNGQKRLNTLTGIITLLIIAASVVPLASVRPNTWALSAAALALLAMCYCAALWWRREDLRVPFSTFKGTYLAFGVFIAYLVFQTLPIGEFAFFSFGGASFTTPTLSITPGTTLITALAFIAYAIVMSVMMQVGVNAARNTLLLNLLLLIIVAYAIYGLVSLQTDDTILGMPKWSYFGMATGPFVNRNSFATFLGFGLLIAFAQFCYTLIRKGERSVDDGHVQHSNSTLFAYGTIMLVLFTTLLATQSRMGLAATLFGMLVIAAITIRWMPRFRMFLIGAIALVAAGAIMLSISGQGVMDRLGSVDNDTEVRTDLYAETWELITQRPLTGFGASSYNSAFPLVHRPPVSPDLTWDKAHNSYLTLWAENGLLFGSIPIFILGFIGWRLIRAGVTDRLSVMPAALGSAVIAQVALHSLVDFSLEIHANALVLCAILGLAVGGTIRLRN